MYELENTSNVGTVIRNLHQGLLHYMYNNVFIKNVQLNWHSSKLGQWKSLQDFH